MYAHLLASWSLAFLASGERARHILSWDHPKRNLPLPRGIGIATTTEGDAGWTRAFRCVVVGFFVASIGAAARHAKQNN
jgi:hypothetical protein